MFGWMLQSPGFEQSLKIFEKKVKCTEFEKVRFDNLKCEFTTFCVFFEILVLPDGISSGGTLPLEVPRAQGLQP